VESYYVCEASLIQTVLVFNYSINFLRSLYFSVDKVEGGVAVTWTTVFCKLGPFKTCLHKQRNLVALDADRIGSNLVTWHHSTRHDT
jgi:hypothetical protein